MCCRIQISPIDPGLARTILLVGRFTPGFLPHLGEPTEYRRAIPEEGCEVVAQITADVLTLNISPAVSIYPDHHGKRRTAGVFLEIAAKYAEKVEGVVVQQANVTGCTDDGLRSRMLAHYPSMPLQFSQICRGWQEEFLTLAEEAGV